MRLVVIVGPTATGKTQLGIEVAHRLSTEIISADSRQVYRGLDLGSGKDLGEYSAVTPPVPYHMIDVADPQDAYTLFHYQRDCHRVLNALAELQHYRDGATPLLMIGGSGLYVESIVRGYRLADVEENTQLRTDLQDLPREDLEARLRHQSAEIHSRTDCSSRRRIIRGLEIAEAATRGPVRYSDPLNVGLDIRILSIVLDREMLRTRIAERLKNRLRDGMVEEVRNLLDKGVTMDRLQRLGLEYREISTYLAGRKTYKSMVSDLETAISQFAKRQETWFRGMPRRGLPVETIDCGDSRTALEIAQRR